MLRVVSAIPEPNDRSNSAGSDKNARRLRITVLLHRLYQREASCPEFQVLPGPQ